MGLLQGSVFPEINLFDLERFEKAFGDRIVVRIAFAGHADQKAVLQENFYILLGGILDASIRMMNNVLGRFPIIDGHCKSGQTQGGIDVA